MNSNLTETQKAHNDAFLNFKTIPELLQKTGAGFVMQQKHLVDLANQDYRNSKHGLNNGYREI